MKFSIPTMMIFVLGMLFQFAAFPSQALAQNGMISGAPVAWERYRVANRKESVLLPKLPTAVHETPVCSDIRIDHHCAYANDAVYEFSVAYQGLPGNYNNCNPKHFGQTILDERLAVLREPKGMVESPVLAKGLVGRKFSSATESRWLFPDIQNHRWIELAVVRRSGPIIDDAKFVDSLDPSSGQGKDIGEGSPVTLGDAGVDITTTSSPAKPQDPKPASGEPYWIIAKPRAPYTDRARKDNLEGSVLLKVVLLANGGVGSVTVSGEALDDGLTEQAIAAAKRLVFLPKKVNGVPISTIVTFQYGFHIY